MSVAVLGGGPAAATAATRLARSGVVVTLFRPSRLGEKPCGGAVPGGLFESLGTGTVAAACTRPSRIVVENAAGTVLEIEAEGLEIYRRRDLDPALVAGACDAGARLVESTVEALLPVDGGVEVSSSGSRRKFSWVVGGDGARGLSRRTVGGAHRCESFGLGASIDGADSSRLVLSFPDAGDSYAWIFPRPGGVSVGLAYDWRRLSHGAAAAVLGRFLDRHLEGGARRLASGRRYRYPIPLFSESTIAAVTEGLGRRIVLVGDAAGVADPLTREGIRYAALSGRWAAECLAAGEIHAYPDLLTERLGDEMARAHRAARLFFEDGLAQWMVPVCRRHRAIRAVLGELVVGRQPYRGLRRRLLRAAVEPW